MFRSLSSLSLSILIAAAGCASTTPASLLDARAAYQRAAQGPAAKLSPAQLHAAQTSLAAAEQTYNDEGDSDNARDRAYVAQRKAELAEAQASIMDSERTSALAAQRVDAAKARALNSSKAELAGERSVVASQSIELQSEKQGRKAAEQRAADAIAALASVASVKQETRGTVITLSGAVIFASGKAELLPGAQAKLDQVATALIEGDPESKILIEGHTDSRGSAALNEDLSRRRAEAVKGYLVSKGLGQARLLSQGVGPSRPIADNGTAEGRANNRRVEIVVQPR